MMCLMQGSNAKTFAKAINSLAKIGSELFVETNDNDLSIRSINTSKSAFASFKFFKDFFLNYDSNTTNSHLNNEFDGKFKVSFQSCLGIFKNMKQVEFCKLSFDSKIEKLVVEMKCRLGTKRKYLISVVDGDTIQTAHAAGLASNEVSAYYKLFNDISNSFQMAEEEITLDVDNDCLTVKNYIEGSTVDSKFMRSQLTLKANEFNKYSVKEKASITFCLREFRAFLSFAESTNENLIINFHSAGQPVDFIIKCPEDFEANLIMSTVSPDDVSFICSENQKITSKSTNNTDIDKSIGNNSMTSNAFSEISIRNTSENFIQPKTIESNNSEIFLNKRRHNDVDTENITEEFSVTFRDTEENESDSQFHILRSIKKARVVFSRCFESTHHSTNTDQTVLANDSDQEE